MTMEIKGTNMELTSAIKDFVREKLGGMDKYFANIQNVAIEVGKTTRGQAKGDVFFCEINVAVPHQLLRYREETDDLYRAINDAKKKIKIELTRYKEKLQS
jgi:putative sigma-54 modulation protein